MTPDEASKDNDEVRHLDSIRDNSAILTLHGQVVVVMV